MESCNGGPIAVTVSRMGLASIRKRSGIRDAGDSEHSAKRSRRGSGNVFRAPMPSNYKVEFVASKARGKQRTSLLAPLRSEAHMASIRVGSPPITAQQSANIKNAVHDYNANKDDIIPLHNDKSKTASNKDEKKH